MIWSFLGSIIVAFFFAGLEAGLTSVHRVRLRQRVREGLPEAVALENLLRHPGRLLTAILILNLLARIFVIAFAYGLLTGWLPLLPALALLIALLPLLAFFLDFLPKVLFRQSPYRRVLLLAGVLHWLSFPLLPFNWLLEHIGGRRFNRAAAGGRQPVLTPAEIREAINLAVADAAITPLQKHFLHSVLNTRRLTLSALTESLQDWPRVEAEEKVSLLLPRGQAEQREIYLVQSGDATPAGAVFLFDLLLDGVRAGSCQSYMRRLPLLDGGESPLIALLKMRSARAPCALVETGANGPRIATARAIVAHLLHGPAKIGGGG